MVNRSMDTIYHSLIVFCLFVYLFFTDTDFLLIYRLQTVQCCNWNEKKHAINLQGFFCFSVHNFI